MILVRLHVSQSVVLRKRVKCVPQQLLRTFLAIRALRARVSAPVRPSTPVRPSNFLLTTPCTREAAPWNSSKAARDTGEPAVKQFLQQKHTAVLRYLARTRPAVAATPLHPQTASAHPPGHTMMYPCGRCALIPHLWNRPEQSDPSDVDGSTVSYELELERPPTRLSSIERHWLAQKPCVQAAVPPMPAVWAAAARRCACCADTADCLCF